MWYELYQWNILSLDDGDEEGEEEEAIEEKVIKHVLRQYFLLPRCTSISYLN